MVEILGFEIGNKSVWVGMEKCESNLKELLNHFKTKNVLMTDMFLMMIFKHLCRGMMFLHAQNIIHRDIKPSNVLIKVKNNAKLDFEKIMIEDFLIKVNIIKYC